MSMKIGFHAPSLDTVKGMYERSLNQILQVLRRIKCLTYGMFLITFTTLVLYLVRDVMTVHLISQQASFPVTRRHPGFAASIQMEFRQECSPQQNIIFTKTHKTGSSTITNILLRYGEGNNRTQLLYKYPSSTEFKKLVPERLLTGRSTANIFAQHANFDQGFLKRHIYNTSKTFTILRSPVSQFLSAFSFFEKTRLYPADTFEESIKLFFKSHGHDKYLTDSWFCKNCGMLVNANSMDMGFNTEGYVTTENQEKYMSDFLEEASRTWDLVLITEYFDLSLVLLKRRFCLQFEDILYLRSLERIKKETVEEPYTLAKIAEMQKLDIALYDYFNATFWREVEKEEGIFEELAIFQKLNKQVQSFCVQGSRVGYQGTYANVLSPKGKENFQCVAMNTRCLNFIRLLEARDDIAVKDEDMEEISLKYTDPDSLNLDQVTHMDRNDNVIDLAYKNRFRF
ncbi:galactosylceramide sulfotransferase-like isoform X3 [Bolinopsis microptera]|uniref:galactosylceramide sulfotransferase-like isoform X3 n=1 Tax=Bolinopsis microptera TaxID=2820187 RepID=UPI00307A09B0